MTWNITIIVIYSIGCAVSFSNIIYMWTVIPSLYALAAIIIHLIKIFSYILGICAGAKGRRKIPKASRKIVLLLSASLTTILYLCHVAVFLMFAVHRVNSINPEHKDYNALQNKYDITVENMIHISITIVLFIIDFVGSVVCVCSCIEGCPLRKSLTSELTEIPYKPIQTRPG